MLSRRNGVENLNRKKATGVTGEDSPTCLVAALQGISDKNELPDEIYHEYEEAFWKQHFEGANSKNSRIMIKKVLEAAGGSSYKGFSEKRARNAQECKNILDNARKGGRRVIIYTLSGHVVGLRPISGGWKMVGSWTPIPGSTVLTSLQVFKHLYIPTRKAGKSCSNIISINPEKNY